MKTFLTATAILLLAAAAAVPAQAQLQVQVEGAADPSFVGGTVVFDSDGVGQRVSKRLFLNFEPVGGQSITLRSVLVRGSQDFSYEIKDVPRLPVVIRNELTLDMFVLYLPTGPGPAQATLELTIQRGESDFEPTDTKYTVNLVGRVPSFTLSYVLPGGSPRPVPVAGTVEFGNKGTRAPTEATLVLANNGSGPGIVQNLSVTGSAAFSLTSPPSVPLRIDPGEVLDLQVAFAPQGTQRYRGQISFDFGVIKQQYNIAGTGGDLLQFSILPLAGDGTPGSATMIESGTEIRFGTGAVKVDVVGRNIMQHSQLVRSIAVTGPFAITNAPTLPATLMSQETLTLSLEPRGIMVGEHSGTLMVGDAHFPLAITVPELPPVRFSQAGGAVTGAEAVPIQLSLTHPYPVEVTGALNLDFFPSDFADDPGVQWSTGGRQAAFRILPGQTEAVFDNGSTTVEFQASTASGEIVVAGRFAAADWGLDLTPDAAPEVRFSVDIPELPQVRYSRSGGMVTGGDEIPMGLSLAQPYPVDLDGSLSLQFVPMEFDNDPLVQWATGGREVAFTIPAGTTSAVFGEDTATVSFRTGGTPGEVVITARFRAESWRNLDVTPDTPPEARFDVQVPDLPEVRFSRSGATVRATDRVSLGLAIAEPFPVDLQGTMMLAFMAEDFEGDPSLQWETGGRQVAFTIAAGETTAMFPADAEEVEFRAGRVQGEVVVSAQFRAPEWNADLTPDDAPQVRFSIDIPELPQVRYSRSGGMVTGGDEIPMGLSLAQPYPVDLDGSLSLQFVPMEFDNDPLVQWATGGREVAFTIPAGRTAAVFGEDSATVSFRTGGTPGEVVITARFMAESWELDVTPDSPPEARFDVQVPDLPEVRFSRSGATVRATDRVSLGLAIAEPFPVDLEGTMILAFMAEDFEGDPSLQWETGGRQVAFTIAAGETAAMFPADAEEVEFRAARVQGEVVVSAQFRAPEWNADLTPDDAPQVRFNVEIQALPQVSYSSTGGTVPPAEQIPVGLSIARPYPTDIVGVLILAFETRVFTTDPSVQWATGGRFVPFTIARGATTALFSLTETTNAFQTGTVAGDIVITARFVSVTEGIPKTIEEAQAQPDALEITPDTAPEVRFTVMEGAPVLQRVTLGAVGQGQFTLQVTGYATPRSVDSIAFEFTGTPDASLQTPSLQADVTQAFRAYYGGSQSVSVGSQFTASAQFTLEEGVFEDLVSVSVNASNGSGESNSVSVSLN